MTYTKIISKAALALILSISLPAYANGVPGQFDYYLLTLSWSPEYCSEVSGNTIQCNSGKHYGFVVHGLWPQYNRGYPETCSTTLDVPNTLVQDMLPIMPSESLIQHEWEKHGTCSGETVSEYFNLIQSTFQTIKIPSAFVNPNREIKTSVAKIRQQFHSANPGLQMVVACKNKYLQEVRLCFDKAMQPRTCSQGVTDHCPASTVIMRPVR